jgi:hypothetical protein
MVTEDGVSLGVPFIGPETGGRAVGAGARPAAISGAVSSGGGNGEGKRGVREMKGAATPFHFSTGERRGCCIGKASRQRRRQTKKAAAACPSAGGRRRATRPRLG